MKTSVTIKKRKIIDIPEDVFKYLSIKAAANGQNLKKFIEDLLIKEVEEMDDSATYTYLSETRPDGKVLLSKQEQEEFEKWLRLKNK